MKTSKRDLVIIGVILAALMFSGVGQSSASPGFTPITILAPRDGQVINKDACLAIVTERLSSVFGLGPAKITVLIETKWPKELVASGHVDVYLTKRSPALLGLVDVLPASPGFTPITILAPRDGQVINKDACLAIVTERLSSVFGLGPAKITVLIETKWPKELVAAGHVDVYLDQLSG